MTEAPHGRDHWERLWSKALGKGRRHGRAPPAEGYDPVLSLYVHVAGSIGEIVRRMASGVRPGGTLFMVGHRPVDPATGLIEVSRAGGRARRDG